MLRLLFPTLLIVLSLSIVSDAQTATPSASPDGDVVRISTSLIQLDVIVTDSKGQPIRDLRPDEVEIYENGKRRNVTNFSFVPGTRSESARTVTNKASGASAAPYLPAGPVRLESVRRTVAIVVDDLNLSFASAQWVKDALKKHIREQVQDGDLIAIIRTGGGSGVLQQFTTDRRQLLASIDRSVFNMRGSARGSFFEPARAIGGVANPKQDEIDQLRENVFGSGTLGVLNFVIRGMSELPGRKSVILMTDGLSIYDRDSKGTPKFSLNYYAVRRLIDYANRSSVSFYPIHAPGLVVPMVEAQDDITDVSLIGGEQKTEGLFRSRQAQLHNTQDGLKFLAENTGGFAIVNSNDMTKGLRRIMDDQSYYLVAYDPDDSTFDNRSRGPFDPQSLKFNKIDVKVNRPGARVRYRSGFLGISDEQNVKARGSVTNEIITAITSPFTTNQIEVRMNAVYMADAQQRPSVVSFINIDPAGLTFTDGTGGLRKTSFDLVAFTFGAEGNVIDERSKNFTVTVTRRQYEVLTQRGLIAAFSLPVKNAGGYQVRLAVRDPSSGRLGTANQFIDVPKVKDGKFALSGAILSSGSVNAGAATDAVSRDDEDPLRYTSVRQFRRGSPLEFSMFAYNPKAGSDRKPRLVQSHRLYKDNTLIFTSAERPVPMNDQVSAKVIGIMGGLVLGEELLPGDYVIEVIVQDLNDKGRTIRQYIQFEIVG